MGFRFRIHVYMIILIWCYLVVVVVVGKLGLSDTLPTYEVTMFIGCDLLCLYMSSRMSRLFFGNEMSSIVKLYII